MAPPLCLPKSVQSWDEMIDQLKGFIARYCGELQGDIRIQENPHDDGIATFVFEYEDQTGCVQNATGHLRACWATITENKQSRMITYVKVYIDEITGNQDWRIYTDE